MAAAKKYGEEVVKRILRALRSGATYGKACAYAGVSAVSFQSWRKRDPEFRAAVEQAEADGVLGWLDSIDGAIAKGRWQAAAWKLERRYPNEYGRVYHELAGVGGGPIQTSLRVIHEVVRRDLPASAPALTDGASSLPGPAEEAASPATAAG